MIKQIIVRQKNYKSQIKPVKINEISNLSRITESDNEYSSILRNNKTLLKNNISNTMLKLSEKLNVSNEMVNE